MFKVVQAGECVAVCGSKELALRARDMFVATYGQPAQIRKLPA